MRQLTAIMIFLAFLGLVQTGFGLFGAIMMSDFEGDVQISQRVLWQYVLSNGIVLLLAFGGLLWARIRIRKGDRARAN